MFRVRDVPPCVASVYLLYVLPHPPPPRVTSNELLKVTGARLVGSWLGPEPIKRADLGAAGPLAVRNLHGRSFIEVGSASRAALTSLRLRFVASTEYEMYTAALEAANSWVFFVQISRAEH